MSMIYGLLPGEAPADEAMHELIEAGFDRDDIALIGPGSAINPTELLMRLGIEEAPAMWYARAIRMGSVLTRVVVHGRSDHELVEDLLWELGAIDIGWSRGHGVRSFPPAERDVPGMSRTTGPGLQPA